MTKSTHKNHGPNSEQLEQFADELSLLREETLAQVGTRDANYIRQVIRIQRIAEIAARLLLVLGFLTPICWVIGVLSLALAKILDNMEIGHNVMHGQYDWMNDPNINSRQFEWDIAADGASWKRYHNYEHHTYTNIIGKDRDFGYGLLRLSDDIGWKPRNLGQFITYLYLSFLFQWGVAYHELAGERVFFGKKRKNSQLPISHRELKTAFFSKAGRQIFKDYVFFPIISGPMFLPVIAGNLIANLLRNLWTSTIIFCGHFTDNIQTFKQSDCHNESQGQWYYRQILGSSNIAGNRWFHILTGHLSFQIEHHLFPDVPALRYPEMANKVQAICQKYAIPYNSGSFSSQYFGVLKRIITYSFPTKRPSNVSAANNV